jgi:hypothetical protein
MGLVFLDLVYFLGFLQNSLFKDAVSEEFNFRSFLFIG